jgi:hypothetical protein
VARRLRGAAFFLAVAVVAFGVAVAVLLADGSSNFAWFLITVGSGLVLLAFAEAVGVERRLRRASPKARLAYVAGSFVVLGAAVAAYVVWQTVALWWLAPVAAFPLYFLLLWERDRPERDRRSTGANGGFEGPLTPPDGADGGM